MTIGEIARRVVIVVIGVSLPYAGGEYTLRQIVWKRNLSNPAVWNLILYTAPISREPNKDIAFRFYGINGEERFRADFRLNNLGFFSKRDYSYQRGPDEFRIVVIGGEQTASSVVDISWPDLLENDLDRLDPSGRYKVFNIAWPDAGPELYIKYWREYGEKFSPDLVIVNYPESDFYRAAPSGVTAMFRGRPVGYSSIEYRLGPGEDDVARTGVPHVEGRKVASFRDPDAVPNRPYGFFIPPAMANSPDKIRSLQRKIVDDFIDPVVPRFGTLLPFFITNMGRLPDLDAATIRNFDPLPAGPAQEEKLVKYGVKYFGWMARNIPRLLLIHNFNFAERSNKFVFTEAMIAKDSAIHVTDMRTRIPKGTSDQDFKSWYMAPEMPEKWSQAGHRAYAQMVAGVVMEWIKDKGR